MIRVIVVDAERNLHQGVGMRLETQADFNVVGTADNLESAIQIVRELHPDVVLLDPSRLDGDPPTVISRVLEASLDASIVVFSLDDDPQARDRMLTAGASAFVSKHDGGQRLLDALRRVAAANL